jgi:hypothetical protein
MAALDALYHSRALYLLVLARQWMKDRRTPVERVFDAAVDVGPAPIRPVLPAFVEWCGRRGVGTFVIVDYLEIAEGEVRSIEGDIDGYARAFPPTPSARVLFVDTLTPMREAQARGERLFDDAIHLTPEGMEIVAEAVAKAIQGR